MRTSTRLEGPWSEERLIGLTPELNPDAASGGDRTTICYAAKTHPMLSPSNRLLYSSMRQLLGPENPFELWTRMDLYVSHVLSIELPTPGNDGNIAAKCPWLVPASEE